MNWLMLTGLFGLMTGPSGSDRNVEALIRALEPEVRAELLHRYQFSAAAFSKVLKFRQPPAFFLSCPNDGCDASISKILADLHEHAPTTLGAQVTDRETAQIEIYVASQSSATEARDRELDDKLHLDTNTTGKRIQYLAQDLPCWTVSYFHKSGVIEKAVIYIDNDSSSRMQYLCAGYETVRAAGVIGLDSVYFYRKDEQHRLRDPVQWLIINAYLHGMQAIKPGDSIEKVHSVLQDRYGND